MEGLYFQERNIYYIIHEVLDLPCNVMITLKFIEIREIDVPFKTKFYRSIT